MTNSVLLIIDSKDMGYDSNSTSDFTIYYKNNPILNKITSFFVKSVIVPNVEYNIHPDYKSEPANNILKIETTDGAPVDPVITVTTITIDPGQYSLAQLITAITGSVGGLALGLTITQDPLTSKLTFTTTDVNGMKIYNYTDGSTIARNLGISTTTAAYSSSVVADKLPDLSGNKIIYLSSTKLASTSSLIDSRLGMIQVITNVSTANTPYGGIVFYETDDYQKDMIQAKNYFNLSTIDLKLLGEYGQTLDLQGLNCTVIIKCYYSP